MVSQQHSADDRVPKQRVRPVWVLHPIAWVQAQGSQFDVVKLRVPRRVIENPPGQSCARKLVVRHVYDQTVDFKPGMRLQRVQTRVLLTTCVKTELSGRLEDHATDQLCDVARSAREIAQAHVPVW